MNIIDKYLKEISMSDEDKIENTSKVGCAVVVKEGDNGEKLVLVLRRSPEDHWPLHLDLPRGKCDYGDDKKSGEPVPQCTIRECKEECGLDIKLVKFIDKFSYLADEGTRKTTQYNFLCKMKNPNQQVKLSEEHDQFMWISSVGEAELMLMPEMKKTISKILNTDSKIVDYPENKIDDVSIDEILDREFK